MSADQDRAERDAWQCTIDACFEHDCDHYRRALEALANIPRPRSADEHLPHRTGQHHPR